jgi:RNA polymerase sigma factor (sigma-70 family)
MSKFFYMPFADHEYLAAIRQGAREPLEELYRTLLPAVYRNIRHAGGTSDDARDLVQDAIILIFNKLRQGDLVLTGSFAAFFLGICRNLWGNRLQKIAGRMVTIPEEAKYNIASDDDWHVHEEQLARHRLFYRAFGQLGALCQQLLRLFMEGKSMEEIMQTLELASYDYTRRRKYLCKEKLIEIIKSSADYTELASNPNHEGSQDG